MKFIILVCQMRALLRQLHPTPNAKTTVLDTWTCPLPAGGRPTKPNVDVLRPGSDCCCCWCVCGGFSGPTLPSHLMSWKITPETDSLVAPTRRERGHHRVSSRLMAILFGVFGVVAHGHPLDCWWLRLTNRIPRFSSCRRGCNRVLWKFKVRSNYF